MQPRTVRINHRGALRVSGGHPWVYSSDILDSTEATPGAAVSVVDPRGRALGTAHFSSTSRITLRMLSRRTEAIDRSWYLGRLNAALEHRRKVVADTEAYRAVYAEADLLPALVVDRYGDCLVVQTLNQGMDRDRPLILSCLQELFSPRAIVVRNDAAVRAKEELPLHAGVEFGSLEGPVEFRMNGFAWQADLLGGQKTGVFLDQRENYRAAERWCKPGTDALDCFTSSGGFALHMARAGANVEAVDSSEAALATARANAVRNGISSVRFREGDVFEVLASHVSARRKFGTVVLDPPAFAKSRGSLEGAARGYKEINLRGLRLLERGGILISCSCSQHFSEAMLLETIAAAANDARVGLRVVERRAQASDHPILLTVPETLYLKCIVLQVI